jgi:hypothetical protein
MGGDLFDLGMSEFIADVKGLVAEAALGMFEYDAETLSCAAAMGVGMAARMEDRTSEPPKMYVNVPRIMIKASPRITNGV